ncbi:MAG: hypothetical protein Q8R70_06770 [Methanoregula sp.]|nr:hypothetical protein [Methanoregula sp.]
MTSDNVQDIAQDNPEQCTRCDNPTTDLKNLEEINTLRFFAGFLG